MCDSTLTVDFEDRFLAHLHLVIGAKIRRGESPGGYFVPCAAERGIMLPKSRSTAVRRCCSGSVRRKCQLALHSHR
jgi:hypothetical protein